MTAILLLLTACSIDKMNLVTNGINGQDGKDGTSVTVSTETTDEGWVIILYTDGVPTDTILIPYPSDGVDGKDGKDGVNGIDGINGTNGVSVTIRTEPGEGGTWLYIQTGDQIETVFIPDGTDGIDGYNGIDGLDGEDGQDGISCTIKTEESEGGYYIIFLENGIEVNRIFIYYGTDGYNGEDGTDGTDGVSSTIETIRIEGGVKITTTTGNTVTVVYLYDGNTGSNGTNGSNGADGLNSITTLEQQGNCIIINSGLDVDGDFILDLEEILYSEQLCDCNLEPNCCPSQDDPQKVALCHQRVIGNVPQYFTIYVPESAVDAHIGHGDNLGECEE